MTAREVRFAEVISQQHRAEQEKNNFLSSSFSSISVVLFCHHLDSVFSHCLILLRLCFPAGKFSFVFFPIILHCCSCPFCTLLQFLSCFSIFWQLLCSACFSVLLLLPTSLDILYVVSVMLGQVRVFGWHYR